MTRDDLYNELLVAGCPVAYLVFEKEQAPPYILYCLPESDDFNADNTSYYKISVGWLEYYSKKPDRKGQKKIEAVFEKNGIPYTREGEICIDDQKVFMCLYNFSIDEED